jgi:hypothetical protein
MCGVAILWVELKKLRPIIRYMVDISAAITEPADELRTSLALTFLQSIPNGPNGKSLGSGLRDQSYLPGQNHAHLALVDEPFRDDCCDPGSTTSVTSVARCVGVSPVFMPPPKHLPRYFFRDTTKGTCRYGPHHPWVRVRELLHLNWRASQSVLQHLGDRTDLTKSLM